MSVLQGVWSCLGSHVAAEGLECDLVLFRHSPLPGLRLSQCLELRDVCASSLVFRDEELLMSSFLRPAGLLLLGWRWGFLMRALQV